MNELQLQLAWNRLLAIVEEQAQVDRAHAADGGRGLAAVAQLVELEIGEHAAAAPEPGVEEDRGHARDQERPPGPVSSDSINTHKIGNQVWGV